MRAAAVGEAAGVRAAGLDRRAMAVLSTGHMFTDIAQGSIPALLPFLISRDHLSYAAASALVLAAISLLGAAISAARPAHVKVEARPPAEATA